MGALTEDKVLQYGREEINLAVYPFSVLNHRKTSGTKTLEFTNVVEDSGGRKVRQQWIVTGSDKYGLPLPADEEIYFALLELSAQQGLPERVHFSRYQVLQCLGWEDSAYNYKRIEDAIDRLANTSISAKNCFKDKRLNEYIKSVNFGIIDNANIVNEKSGRKARGQGSLPLSSIKWNEVILGSVREGYAKSIDLRMRASLKGALAKRLHQFLDVKFGSKRHFFIGAAKLAGYLGLRQDCKTFGRVKSRVEPAIKELVAKGYLSKFSYEVSKSDSKDRIVHFTRAAAAAAALPSADNDDAPCSLESVKDDPAGHFYRQLNGRAPVRVSEGERKAAAAFVEEHGVEAWRAFADFAVNYRDEKWPEMKRLGGALKACREEFLGAWESWRRRRDKDLWRAEVEAQVERLKERSPEKWAAFEAKARTRPDYLEHREALSSRPWGNDDGKKYHARQMRDALLRAFQEEFFPSS
jgi:hypothetical protein